MSGLLGRWMWGKLIMGLVLDGMACERVPRMLGLGVSVVNGMLHWRGMVLWGGVMNGSCPV